MIIRRNGASQQLISQPHHAQLAARIMEHWRADRLPDNPRYRSILSAIEHHDDGWAEVDAAPVVDDSTGRLLDFIEVPDAVKRATASRGLEALALDPYAAALVAQHRLHVYRRYLEHDEWRAFFADMAMARERYLRDAGSVALDVLLGDYRFVRAADLASLAFCNMWEQTDGDDSGYSMRLEGTRLLISPDPFNGATVPIGVEAREVREDRFASAAEAQRAVNAGAVVLLSGTVRGRVQ